jgi:hypothetical protein
MVPFWSEHAAQMVRDLMLRLPFDAWDGDPWICAHSQRLAALPINLDLWSFYFLSPCGRVFKVADYSADACVTKWCDDPIMVTLMLVWGRDRYPPLAELLPQRQAGSTDCRCRKAGIPPGFLCPHCGGVGWLPPANVDQHGLPLRSSDDAVWMELEQG